MVGYVRVLTNYRLHDPVIREILTSRDIIFKENNEKFIYSAKHDERFTLPRVGVQQNVKNQDGVEENEQFVDSMDSEARIRCQGPRYFVENDDCQTVIDLSSERAEKP